MIFDSLLLTAVRDELGQTLVGGKIEKITQPDPSEIFLRFYKTGHKHNLLLSCDASHARAHLTIARRDNPPTPPVFCSVLRRYLDTAWLDDISLPLGFGERVLHLHFKAVDGAPYTLIAEMMGKHSNLILINGAGMILGAAKNIGRSINRLRQIQPGITYVPPPRQRGRRDPLKPLEEELETETLSAEAASEWLVSQWSGVSPLLASEIIARVGGGVLTQQTLHQALAVLLTVVRVGDWSPRVWTDDRGLLLGAYPVPLRTVKPVNQHARESISVALDQAATSLLAREAFDHARESLLAALRRTRKLREREVSEIESGLQNAARAEEYRQSGDLVLANRFQIVPGQASAAVPDYYAPLGSDGEPETRTISLDPALTVTENAERFYKRSRKAEGSVAMLLERQETARAEAARLAQAEVAAGRAATSEEITALRLSLGASLTQNNAPGQDAVPRPAAPDYEGHKIKRYLTVDGWEILVGENALSNDYLTTKLASASDIWLHVRTAASAHGIIRAKNKPASVSQSALQQAAEMVAARSEVKHSSLIPVDYTLKKHVRKPRKSAPGQVVYQNEKTLFVAGIHGEQ